jgi:fatty acid desaturase
MQFSLQQARALVADLFRPDPFVYWTDFLATVLSGYVLAALVRRLPHLVVGGSWLWMLQAACFIGSALLLYRAALFIHELSHLPKRKFRAFRIVWNLLCGIPFLMPSFLYDTHLDHHRRKSFGTREDGEYLPWARRGWQHIALFLVGIPLIPLAAIVRFAILTPLAWLHPAIRRWVHVHASSLIVDPAYLRPLPTAQDLRAIWWQELGCFAFCLIAPLVAARFGFDPLGAFIQAYCTAVFVIGLNALRTLGAHRWWNEGRELTFVEQMLDSVNVDGPVWITELWGPLGLRYHALHHLFPSLPYHNIAAAHRRLMQQLPPDSPYRRTVEPSLTTALLKLLRRSWNAGQASRSVQEAA